MTGEIGSLLEAKLQYYRNTRSNLLPLEARLKGPRCRTKGTIDVPYLAVRRSKRMVT